MDKIEKILFKFLFILIIFCAGSIYGHNAGINTIKEWEEKNDKCLFCEKDKDLSWEECLTYCRLEEKEKEKIKRKKEIRLDIPVQLQFELWGLTPEQKYWAREIMYQCERKKFSEVECR